MLSFSVQICIQTLVTQPLSVCVAYLVLHCVDVEYHRLFVSLILSLWGRLDGSILSSRTDIMGTKLAVMHAFQCVSQGGKKCPNTVLTSQRKHLL